MDAPGRSPDAPGSEKYHFLNEAHDKGSCHKAGFLSTASRRLCGHLSADLLQKRSCPVLSCCPGGGGKGGKERGGDMREGRGERGGFTAAWAGSSMRSRISSMFEAPALLWVDEKTSQEEEEEEG